MYKTVKKQIVIFTSCLVVLLAGELNNTVNAVTYDEDIQVIVPMEIISSEAEPIVINTLYKHPQWTGYLNCDCGFCEPIIGARYGFTEKDIHLLAQLLCGDWSIDGDGEYDFVWSILNDQPVDSNQISLVLCVVMNRVRDYRFPNTVREVVMQDDPSQQFSVMPDNIYTVPDEIAIEIIGQWCESYDRWQDVQTIPMNHLYFTGDGTINVSSESW